MKKEESKLTKSDPVTRSGITGFVPIVKTIEDKKEETKIKKKGNPF